MQLLLRHVRKKAGLTIEQVAERMDLSTSQVSRYESGKSDPSLSTLRKFSEVYKCEVVDLFDDHPDAPLDVRFMETVIERTEELLQREAINLEPHPKAHLISSIYGLERERLEPDQFGDIDVERYGSIINALKG